MWATEGEDTCTRRPTPSSRQARTTTPVPVTLVRRKSVQLPAIKVNIRYGVSNCVAMGCSLSSDMMGDLPGSTFHADFWNTWDQSALEQLVQSQLNS